MKDPLSGLSRREREIMDILYEKGEQSAAEVMNAMSDPPGYSTVRSLMTVLVEKGHTLSSLRGKALYYKPSRAKEKVRDAALQKVVRSLFGGSALEAVSALLNSKEQRLSPEEILELEELVKRAKEQEL